MRKILLGLTVALLTGPMTSSAQSVSGSHWSWSAGISASWLPGDPDWSVTHPYVGGSGTSWETLRGTFSSGIRVQGDLGVRRGRIGLRGTVGIMPQTFTQESPVQEEDFKLLTGGIAGVIYLQGGDHRRWEPFTALGIGGLKAIGGLNNTGFYLTAVGGFRVRITEELWFEGGAEFNRFKYTQIDIGNNIQKDMRVSGPSVFLGTRIIW